MRDWYWSDYGRVADEITFDKKNALYHTLQKLGLQHPTIYGFGHRPTVNEAIRGLFFAFKQKGMWFPHFFINKDKWFDLYVDYYDGYWTSITFFKLAITWRY